MRIMKSVTDFSLLILDLVLPSFCLVLVHVLSSRLRRWYLLARAKNQFSSDDSCVAGGRGYLALCDFPNLFCLGNIITLIWSLHSPETNLDKAKWQPSHTPDREYLSNTDLFWHKIIMCIIYLIHSSRQFETNFI